MGMFGKKREPRKQPDQPHHVRGRYRGMMDPESLLSESDSSGESYTPPDPPPPFQRMHRVSVSVENPSHPGVPPESSTDHNTSNGGSSTITIASSPSTHIRTKTRNSSATAGPTASGESSSVVVAPLEVGCSEHAQPSTTLPAEGTGSRMPLPFSMRFSRRFFSSFTYRVKSFRYDRRAAQTDPRCLVRDPLAGTRSCPDTHSETATKKHHETKTDAPTVSSGSSRSGSITDNDNGEDGSASDVSLSYQQFDLWTRKLPHATRGSTIADTDDDSLRDDPCNDYAREQVHMWKAASIEGPRPIQLAALGLTSVVLCSAIVLVIAAGGSVSSSSSSSSFWTPGAVVACCHLVVASSLILLFETRSKKGLETTPCGCLWASRQRSSSGEDFLDEDLLVLPMDAYKYRHYGEGEYEYYDSHAMGTKARGEVLKRISLFRYLYGRGCLYVFAGSMTLAVIPGSWRAFPGPFLALCLPGMALVLVGIVAILFGAHASFRWTLLTTSIRCSDEHLLEKFVDAKMMIRSKTKNNNNNSKSSGGGSNPLRMNQTEFAILVTTLGLDLDESALIPHVFLLDIMPRDRNGMAFEEFRRWWRGIPRGGSRRRTTRQTPRGRVAPPLVSSSTSPVANSSGFGSEPLHHVPPHSS